ncbi:hypothetical protein CRG98_002117 [Punica granatum]|uniref:Uncharacterized protein n=1 Tax=Punica granatum TaxID=22663 RepID=A0A2I0L9Z4_PUNGR|nr:hypothetical protein CRG98_002117 [Punica granatum]
MVMTMEMDDYGVEVAMVKIKMSLMKVEMATEKGEMAMLLYSLSPSSAMPSSSTQVSAALPPLHRSKRVELRLSLPILLLAALPWIMVMVGLLWGRNKGDYRDGIREGGEGWVGAVLEVLGGGAAGVGGGEDRVTEGALEPHGPGEAGVAGEREREEER